MALKDLLSGGLAALKSPGFEGEVRFDEDTGAYLDSHVYRGFPLGTLGAGGVGLGTDGGFVDLRLNNNWMRPIRHLKGSFFAVGCKGESPQGRLLRRSFSGGEDYAGLPPVAHTRFTGALPGFELVAEDDLPVAVTISGFSPLVPHDERAATAPVVFFDVTLSSRSDAQQQVSFVFSWENTLGRGGSGQTGISATRGVPTGATGRLKYDSVEGATQQPLELGALRGLSFQTRQQWPEGSHRRGVLGRMLLLAEAPEGWQVLTVQWDADDPHPPLLEALAQGKPLDGLRAPAEAKRPAGAVVVQGDLEPGATLTFRYTLVWWTPEHTTETNLVKAAASSKHKGERVGHRYERYFGGAPAVARWATAHHDRLKHEALALESVLAASSLPSWLRRALLAAADSAVVNTIVPRDKALHTLEAADWQWYFGGLTGTNDQRLAAHPYMATFFTALDRSELDVFRRLARDGVVPHGNGNCDLALESSDVPYGEPVQLVGALNKEPWPDLTLSCILQTYRHHRLSGDDAWMTDAWPDLLTMIDAVAGLCVEGVPEGGSTYDTLRFPGTFSYTATLWLAALDAMLDLAPRFGPERAPWLSGARQKAAARVDEALWDTRGFYKASASKPTLFAGALAGDWFARWAGLAPVLPPERCRSHMQQVYRALIRPWLAGARRGLYPAGGIFEAVEASFDGEPVVSRLLGMKVHGYVWQVVSYYAVEAIALGQVQEGLQTLEAIYARIWQGGWPWSADLYGNAGPVYMSHPALWSLPNMLAGASLDVPRGQLRLDPQPGHLAGPARLPVFFPGLWAMLEQGEGWTLRVLRTFGGPIEVRQLSVAGGAYTRLDTPWLLTEGSCWALEP